MQDGEVPVVMVSNSGGGSAQTALGRGSDVRSPVPRPTVATIDASAERQARERAERALHQVQMMVRDLETKLAHADMARQEAVNAAKTAKETAAAIRAERVADLERFNTQLTEERNARQRAEQALQKALANSTGERVRRAYTRRKPRPELLATDEIGLPHTVQTEMPESAAPPVPKLPRVRAAKAPKPPRQRAEKAQKPVKWWVKTKPAK